MISRRQLHSFFQNEHGSQAISQVAILAVGATVLIAAKQIGFQTVEKTGESFTRITRGEPTVSPTAPSATRSPAALSGWQFRTSADLPNSPPPGSGNDAPAPTIAPAEPVTQPGTPPQPTEPPATAPAPKPLPPQPRGEPVENEPPRRPATRPPKRNNDPGEEADPDENGNENENEDEKDKQDKDPAESLKSTGPAGGSGSSAGSPQAGGFPTAGFAPGFPGNGFGNGYPGNGFGNGFPGNGFPSNGFPGNGYPNPGFANSAFPQAGSSVPGLPAADNAGHMPPQQDHDQPVPGAAVAAPASAPPVILQSITPDADAAPPTTAQPLLKQTGALEIQRLDRRDPKHPRLQLICRRPFVQLQVHAQEQRLAFNAPKPGELRSLPLPENLASPGDVIHLYGLEPDSAEVLHWTIPDDDEKQPAAEQPVPDTPAEE